MESGFVASNGRVLVIRNARGLVIVKAVLVSIRQTTSAISTKSTEGGAIIGTIDMIRVVEK